MLRANDSVSRLRLVILVLLIVEGVLVCLGAVGYAGWLLSRVARHRAALYTVFLTVPNNCLRMLGSKSISLGDEEDEEEEGARPTPRPRPLAATLEQLLLCSCQRS